MKKFVFDIEVFPNFWCCTFLDIETQEKEIYVIYKSRNDGEKLARFLSQEIQLIGYNNLIYDSILLNFVANNYNSLSLLFDVFELSSSIISDKGPRFVNYHKLQNPESIRYTQMDLMKIMAFDKLGIGLKQCAINLRWYRIQDLPLPYNHEVEPKEVSLILDYNMNDVLITLELYKKIKDIIDLRTKLSNLFETDLTNASDSKMANIILEDFYSKQDGVNLDVIRGLRTPRFQLMLSDCLGKNIEFKTNKLKRIKNEIANTLVREITNFRYSKKIEFGGIEYELGVGGLHSVDGPAIFEATDDLRIVDSDASSYYPSIMIQNEIVPEHLGKDFTEVLKKITKERLVAKKSKDKTKADGLKITINSIFGKLGSNTFWLQDPKAFLSVTISGQLYLLMLIESLVLSGIKVISANTDGIVSLVKKEQEKDHREICEWWQKKTGFELEHTDYSIYARIDVNNYVTKKANGETKTKGRFITENDLKKGYKYPIVAKCLFEYFVNNKPVNDTLHCCNDILDFCISQKTGGDFQLEYHTDDNITKLQKNNRFYISNSGGKLIKRHMVKDSTIGLYVGNLATILNNHDSAIPFSSYDINFDFYEEEINKYLVPIEENRGKEIPLEFIDEPENYKPIGDEKSADKEALYLQLNGIKNLSDKLANNLVRLNKEFAGDNFYDLLVYAENNSLIGSKYYDLIQINYFSKYGPNKKLLTFYAEFTKGKNKYKNTLSEKSKEKRLRELKVLWDCLPNEKLSVKEQIDAEIKVLGRIQSLFSGLDKRYAYVLGVNTKYSPRLQLYSLASGTLVECKMQKKLYDITPAISGDILYCRSFERKPAVKFIDNHFEEDLSKPNVWWIVSFKKVTDYKELGLDKN